jgi:hypothetical protein
MFSYVLFEYLLSLILNSKRILYKPLLKLSFDDVHIEVLRVLKFLSIKPDVSLIQAFGKTSAVCNIVVHYANYIVLLRKNRSEFCKSTNNLKRSPFSNVLGY